jgi:hypothetical protein
MVLTRLLDAPEDTRRIDGIEAVHHVYASERSIAGLIRHQTRLVIGGAINAAVFAYLLALPEGDIAAALAAAALDDGWLAAVIRDRLPARPYGWVPPHFLTKRVARGWRGALRPRALAVLAAGFGFDLVVYMLAQLRMARGVGAGHW